MKNNLLFKMFNLNIIIKKIDFIYQNINNILKQNYSKETNIENIFKITIIFILN